jgi:hypothetical protein
MDIVSTGWVYHPLDGPPSHWLVDVVEVPIPDRPASCGKPAETARAWQVAALRPRVPGCGSSRGRRTVIE